LKILIEKKLKYQNKSQGFVFFIFINKDVSSGQCNTFFLSRQSIYSCQWSFFFSSRIYTKEKKVGVDKAERKKNFPVMPDKKKHPIEDKMCAK
jgi:hypothetical protein